RIDGWIGGPATYLPALTLHNVFLPKLEGYRPACTKTGQAGEATLEMDSVDLRPGWELGSQESNEQVRPLLVFGGAARPGYDKKKEGGAYPADEKPQPPKRPDK